MKEYMKEICSLEEFEAAAQGELSVFVFSANWCPDCHFITPFMPELIAKYKQIAFYYVDRDTCMDICIQLQIMGIPSFVAYSKGEEIARFVSRLRKTKDEIDTFLSELPHGKEK